MTQQPICTDREIQQPGDDNLDFGDYGRVLAGLIATADTPLTIGVFGPWGSGKSSLMRLVKRQLAESPPGPPQGGEKSEIPPSGGSGGPEEGKPTPAFLTVWFNAWKYDREEALWRALIIQVLNAFRPPEKPVIPPDPGAPAPTQAELKRSAAQEKANQALNRRLDDLEASLYRTVEREELGGVTVDWTQLAKGSIKGLTHLSLSALPLAGPLLGKMMEEAEKKISGEDLTTIFDAIQRERRKIYRRQIQSLEQFTANFEQLVQQEVIAKKRRLVIFIDDLDRCLPEKAIEVLEALKLFLDAPGCLFCLGVDREVIQQGIRVKYKGFLVEGGPADRRIPISGDDYLEKIVQLPFHLLPLNESRVQSFIERSGPPLPAGCAALFAAGLEANPRKIKRALNIFTILLHLAQLRGDDFEQPIKPHLLAKTVIIQSRHRPLYYDWLEYPSLLPDLERDLTGDPPPAPSSPAAGSGSGQPTKVETYRQLRWLKRLLAQGDRFSDLPESEVKLYLYLAHTTAEGPAAAAEQAAARLWDDLRSGDPTRLNSAAAAIRADNAVAGYCARLAAALRQPDQPDRDRLALGLSALRPAADLKETVGVPAGPYPVGPAGQKLRLEGFKLGRYPVTNRQYQEFLADTLDHDPPPHWDPVTRRCPPELADHPVVNVSWPDAHKYCQWAARRLPPLENWEAAALGREGRLYPWGDAARSGLAHTAESGLAAPVPVGLFPDGAAPCGALDMAGNVWEWTATADGANYRVKGGAFDTPLAEATCAAGQSLPPETRRPNLGFRVME